MREKISAEAVKKIFCNCYDYDSRQIAVGGVKTGVKATMCYIDGCVSGRSVSEEILQPATDISRFGKVRTESEAIALFMQGQVFSFTARLRLDLSQVTEDLLNGFCAMVFDGAAAAVTFEARSGEKRAISEPKDEKVVKGSKDVFIELIKINTLLIRRRLKNPQLKLKQVMLGKSSGLTAVIAYIEGYTDTELVKELERRLNNMETDGVISASVIEENLYDRPKTLFPQMLRTERPDRFCMNLMEGRVGLLVDGLPMGYLAPGTFSQFFKVPDDISQHYIVASALTVLRYAAMFIALILPALYVAIVMYHQEMLPTRLLMSIIESRKAVPFPSSLEVLAMLISFELLQEAGLRLPNTVGQTVSIIGALIVGQSAVEARVVSPVVVIVVALSGISGYTVPDQDMSSAVRVFRLLLVFSSIVGGLFGMILAFTGIVYHLCTIECFGVSYMAPFAGGKDKKSRAILRLPVNKTRRLSPELGKKEDGK